MIIRPLTFEQAKSQFVHRFTMEHVPSWAKQQREDGSYYAPQYSSDLEWYNRTFFKGESELPSNKSCYSYDPSWPLGKTLTAPYMKR